MAPEQVLHAGTEPGWSGAPSGAADPVVVGGSILGALALGAALAAVLRWSSPPAPPRPVREPAPLKVVPPVPDTSDAATVPGARSRVHRPSRPSSPAPEVRPEVVSRPAAEPVATGVVGRLWQALSRSRAALKERVDALLSGPLDDEAFEQLEEVLIAADIGMVTATRLLDRLRASHRSGADADTLRLALKDEMKAIVGGLDNALEPAATQPWVILVVGVNGSGKTTTIGKLAARLGASGKKVLLAAGDTYRAAAAAQLEVWAERAGADIVVHDQGADPGAVVYEALDRARAAGHHVVIIDTAGRLQTRRPLMEQLAKIRRVIRKTVPDGPHETLLVLDGTMGQNGLSQARLFHEATPLTGVVVTKLDGTAKGGMVLTIAAEMALPIKLIGIGEQVEDLRDFDADAFVEALG